MERSAAGANDPVLQGHKIWVAMSKEHDFAKLESILCDDVILMPPNDTSLFGKAEVLEWFKEYFDNFQIANLTPTERDVFVSGDVAIENWTYMVAIKPVDGSDRIRDDGRFLTIWKKQDDGRWKPTFSNARYLFGRRELADWMTQHDAGRALPIHARALEQSVIPIVEAGKADLVDDGHELGPGLQLAPLPGHTSGQMGLVVNYARNRAIFCGDAIHHPLQIFQPGLSTSTCVDQKLAAETRKKILAEAADSGRLVVPAHFRGQRRAHVRAGSGGYEPVFGNG